MSSQNPSIMVSKINLKAVIVIDPPPTTIIVFYSINNKEETKDKKEKRNRKVSEYKARLNKFYDYKQSQIMLIIKYVTLYSKISYF